MTQYTRFFRAFIPLLILLTTEAAAQSIRPLNDRIDAIVAHPLVLPVLVNDPKSIQDSFTVRLDDGRHVPAHAFFVWASTPDNSTNWTRPTPNWTLLSAKDYLKSNLPLATIPGTWIALIDLPIDAVGQGIWIDEIRYEPNWLPSPQRVLLETSSRANDGFWDAALTQPQQHPPLIKHAITNLRVDPFNRWRAQLLTEGFHPKIDHSTNPAHSDRDLIAIHTELLQSDSSHVLDSIASHFTARWQIILGRIWLIDPAVARRLKHQLTRTASTGDSLVPLWTDDTSQLSDLAHDLLSPFVNDTLRVERVVAWLHSQPNSLAWIIDDAGFPARAPTTVSPATVSPTIGLLWIPDNNKTESLAQIQSFGIEPAIQRIPANLFTSTTITTAAVPTYNFESINEPRNISVQINSERTTLKTQQDMPAASPPGVIVGPLLMDWTLAAFNAKQSGMGVLPPPSIRSSGLIHRVADLNEPDHRKGWRLYLELAIDPHSTVQNATVQNTTIQISMGPYGLTIARWTISQKFGLTESRTNQNITHEPTLHSTTQGDRWIIELQIPPEAISKDGFLLLGLERIDTNDNIQTRTAWPRRMMPWQNEPGRFIIDTTSWMGTTQSTSKPTN